MLMFPPIPPQPGDPEPGDLEAGITYVRTTSGLVVAGRRSRWDVRLCLLHPDASFNDAATAKLDSAIDCLPE